MFQTKSLFLIEPTWLSGGMIENGMAYGLSYIAYRSYYYNEFEIYYPNALTWNGKNEPLQYLKMIEANNEAIFKSGRSISYIQLPDEMLICFVTISIAVHSILEFYIKEIQFIRIGSITILLSD